MRKITVKDYWLIFSAYILSILFAALVIRTIYPLHFSDQTLFFLDLLGFSNGMPGWLIYIFGLMDLLLIFLVGRIFFKRITAYLFMLFFGLSPWFIYSVIAGSFYIYLLGLLLVIFLSLDLMRSGRSKIGRILFVLSSSILLYSSIILFLSYTLFIIGTILLGFIKISKIWSGLLLVFIICIPLFFLSFKNYVGLKNIFHNQVNFLSDPGIVNSINVFQGESKKQAFRYLSKISENKYSYVSRYMILKLIQNVIPSTFFTPEEKLLGFSFAPPVYFGMLIPFLYGLYLIARSRNLRRYLILSLILVIPSFFSKMIVDLNRLILFMPVIFFIVVYGFEKLNTEKTTKLVVVFCSTLILIQFIVTISDLSLREYPRFERYAGVGHWQIDRQ